ncbi:MAG: CPBP family intramembrane glutamic endopeptidase [Microbacterium sp.]
MLPPDVPAPPPSFPPPPPAYAAPAPVLSEPVWTNASATAAAPEVVEAVPFHRLNIARGRPPRWWRPLLTALLAFGFYIAGVVLFAIPLGIAAAVDPVIAERIMSMADAANVDMTDPLTFTVAMGSIILMLPALLFASRIVAGRGVGLLSSVAGRLRWGWLLRSLAASAAVFVLANGLLMAIAAAQGEPLIVAESQPWWMLVMVLLLVPVQCAAEEYVFRGFLMQTIGSWLRHPAFAILLPLPFFVFGHLYDVWGLLSVATFALAAGWLTWRTGGLEAGIALHIVNNLSVFVLAAFGLADANADGGGALDLLFSVLIIGLSTFVIDRLWRRSGLARTRELRWPGAVPAAAE